MSIAVKIVAAILGALVGLSAFYYGAAYTACFVLWPQSNLCGLPAALFAAPLGAIVGAVGGWLIARGVVRRA